MTLQEAGYLSKHAEDFVLRYMTPILGEIHTSQVHKVLRHVLSSINMLGSLKNGNTNASEAGHNLDKKFYRRTNQSIATFTAQIVRQAQGKWEFWFAWTRMTMNLGKRAAWATKRARHPTLSWALQSLDVNLSVFILSVTTRDAAPAHERTRRINLCNNSERCGPLSVARARTRRSLSR